MSRHLEQAVETALTHAIDACSAHVSSGGIPFAGVVLDTDGRALSNIGFNRVAETGDPTAHAEIVAMREAMTVHALASLEGRHLLATGEPCGLCYRFAIDCGITQIHVAADRNQAARHGFDYRASYRAFGITDALRASLLHAWEIPSSDTPFTRYSQIHISTNPPHPTKGHQS